MSIPYLSIVIPAYNEENKIFKTIKSIVSYLNKRKFSYEIIVIDDGSKDNTVNIIKSINNNNIKLFSNIGNKGKGYSIKQGMLKAKGRLLLFSDADLSTPIEELDNFLKFIPKYDIVIGSRAVKGHKIKISQPIYRVLIGKTFNQLVRLFTSLNIHDTQCGFKLFKNNVAKEIFSIQEITGFCFDVEVLYIAQKKGYKIKELPINWYNCFESKVSPLTDSVRMFLDLLAIRFNRKK